MEKIACIIVEDENSAAEKLASFINKIDYLDLKNTFSEVTDALNWLAGYPVDLIFLDLHLGELNGFELLKNLRTTPKVIITTAFSEYAVESYRYFIDGYLLKPYSFSDFLQSVSKIAHAPVPKTDKKKEFAFIKTEYHLEKILLEDILYLEGMKDYIKIVLKDRQIMTLMNFREISELLNPSDFYRVHHSYIVAVNKIDLIERSRIKIRNKYIPISDRKKAGFLEFIHAR